MTVSVVQQVSAQAPGSSSYTATFGANVTAGNTIILVATAAGSGSYSSSGPTFNGSTPPGSVKVIDHTEVTNQLYEAIWLMPDVAGGATGVGLTVVNNAFPGASTGLTAYEVSGLGSSPVIDRTMANDDGGSPGSSLSSGTTATTRFATELVVGALVNFGNAVALAGSPWTELHIPGGSNFSVAGYQVAASETTFDYASTASASAAWMGIIATIAPASGIIFDNSGGTAITTGTTSATVDITSATTGSFCYAWCAISTGATTQTGIPSNAGWTTLQSTETASGTSGAAYAIYRRQKVSGDTTFSFGWSTSGKGAFAWASYIGLNTAGPDEQSAVALNDTTSRSAIPTPSATPSGSGEWALAFFGQRSTASASKPTSWTAAAGLTARQEEDNSAAASSPWLGTDIEDSDGAVAESAQSYTATSNVTQSHDGSGILFLVPVPSGGTPHTATASLAITPSFTATPVRGHYRTASLSIIPVFRAIPAGSARTVLFRVSGPRTAWEAGDPELAWAVFGLLTEWDTQNPVTSG